MSQMMIFWPVAVGPYVTKYFSHGEKSTNCVPVCGNLLIRVNVEPPQIATPCLWNVTMYVPSGDHLTNVSVKRCNKQQTIAKINLDSVFCITKFIDNNSYLSGFEARRFGQCILPKLNLNTIWWAFGGYTILIVCIWFGQKCVQIVLLFVRLRRWNGPIFRNMFVSGGKTNQKMTQSIVGKFNFTPDNRDSTYFWKSVNKLTANVNLRSNRWLFNVFTASSAFSAFLYSKKQ